MSGTITVSRTGDWLTPYAVTVDIDGRQPSESRFSAQARTKAYAEAMAFEHGLEITWDVDVSPLPTNSGNRKTSKERQAEFPHRHKKPCAKCRVSKPLAEFRVETRQNATRRDTAHMGWADRCLECEGSQ